MVDKMDQLSLYETKENKPLAHLFRPNKIDDFYGQETSINVIKKMLEKKEMLNLIIYGPSGTGKTTLARIICNELEYNLVYINAINTSSTKIKEIAKSSKEKYKLTGKKTVVLLDEIHRFNKLQQDSLLEDIEYGNFIIIATTTENPYYELNKAIISRCIVIKFDKLNDENISNIIRDIAKKSKIQIDDEIEKYILSVCDGDARIAINILELIEKTDINTVKIGVDIKEKYSKEEKYDRISALIKSIRGSDVDATVYWLSSLISSGEDISYIARRLVISASEDIGLANINAMNIATSTMLAIEKIGLPEARIILSNCAVYLALSPKSNSSYLAVNKALEDIEKNGVMNVPYHLQVKGRDKYLYPHDYENNYVKQKYMDKAKTFYNFANNKHEKLFKEYWKKIKGDNDGK